MLLLLQTPVQIKQEMFLSFQFGQLFEKKNMKTHKGCSNAHEMVVILNWK